MNLWMWCCNIKDLCNLDTQCTNFCLGMAAEVTKTDPRPLAKRKQILKQAQCKTDQFMRSQNAQKNMTITSPNLKPMPLHILHWNWCSWTIQAREILKKKREKKKKSQDRTIPPPHSARAASHFTVIGASHLALTDSRWMEEMELSVSGGRPSFPQMTAVHWMKTYANIERTQEKKKRKRSQWKRERVGRPEGLTMTKDMTTHDAQ